MSTPHGGSSDADISAFLQRVRGSLGHSESSRTFPPPAPPAVPDELVRRVSRGDDLVSTFVTRASKVGMSPIRVTQRDFATVLARALQEHGVRRVGLAAGGRDDQIVQLLASGGFEVLAWRDHEGMGGMYDADAGITDVDAAIAETGTLVCTSSPGRPRGLSLAPPLHVALVPASRILPDMLDYLATPAAASGSSTVFITGPSKTADIEGILITGVHGPRAVVVLVIEDA